jgi:hypothetical protein
MIRFIDTAFEIYMKNSLGGYHDRKKRSGVVFSPLSMLRTDEKNLLKIRRVREEKKTEEKPNRSFPLATEV